MCVIVISSSALQCPNRTPKNRSCEVLDIVHNAGVVTLSVESEGKQTGGLYAFKSVPPIIKWVCPADLRSDLTDVAIASSTGRVRVSRWNVVHVVLSCNPGQEAGQLRVDDRVGGEL